MSGRSLRPRDSEDPKSGSKGKGKSTPVKYEQAKALRKKSEPLFENKSDVDPWLKNGDWSHLFSEAMLVAIKAAKCRKKWEIKLTVCISQMALQVRHVPGHRIPETMTFFQPIAGQARSWTSYPRDNDIFSTNY